MDVELQEEFIEEQEESITNEEEKEEHNTLKESLIKLKSVDDAKCEGELLGSVTTINSPGVRTSARVIQKMKQDQTRPITPPPEKKEIIKEEKTLQRTPVQIRSSKVVWSNTEKNLFFDALNEFGRDFECISNFINSKLKRKNSTAQGYKSKEHVRQTFYQTFHKISKFVKFSDEVKKPAQELYALVNYGEMRRRLSFVSEKNLMKIRDLIYKGYATLRSKGKTVRIKTPSCKALRKLNELEDWLEDIKLPNKVEICLQPATMESWGKVQSIAQNPVVRTVVPLQKKLSSIIRTFQYRWRSHETKINEEALKVIGSSFSSDQLKSDIHLGPENEHMNLREPLICFTPHQDTTIHRPLVSITEYLSSFNICLNSYEERIGVKIRGETLCHEKHSTKRQRSDSGCEKKSPEHKKFRVDSDRQVESDEIIKDEKEILRNESSDATCGDLSSEDFLIDDKINIFERQDSSDLDYLNNDFDSENPKCTDFNLKGSCSPESANKVFDGLNKQQKKKEMKCAARKKDKKEFAINHLRPLISEDVQRKIRKGWTILNCGDITIGDLYVAFGQDSKLTFEYSWINNNKDLEENQHKILYGANNNNSEDEEVVKQIQQSSLGSKLKQLLLIAQLNENARRKPCYCGHTCDRTGRPMLAEDTPRSYISNKTYTASHNDNVVFRQPVAPFRRNAIIMDSIRRTSTVGLKHKPTRFGAFGSRQIVVKRLLPVQNGTTPEIEVKTLQNHFTSIQRSPEHSIEEISDEDSLKEASDGYESSEENNQISTNIIKSSDLEENVIDSSDTDTERNLPCRTENLQGSSNISNSTELVVYSDLTEKNKKSNNCKDDITFCDKQSASLEEVPDLSQLMDLPLSSPLPMTTLDESTSDIINNIPPLSPMQIVREGSSDPKWLEDNINDFSLSSFLGHLDEISSRDGSENTNVSLSESSMDYMRKFAEIAASIQNEDKEDM